MSQVFSREAMRKDLFARVALAAWRHARLLAVGAALLVLASPVVLMGLRVDSDSSRLLPPDEPLGQAFREQRARFGESGPLLLLLRRSGGDEEAFDAFTEALGTALADWPDMRFVDYEVSGPSRQDEIVQRLRAAFSKAGPETLRALADRFTEPGMARQLRRLRKRLVTVDDPDARALMLADPLGVAEHLDGLHTGTGRLPTGRFIDSPDRSFRIIWAQPSESAEDGAYCVDLVRRLDALVGSTRSEIDGAQHFEYQVSGVHAITAESAQVLVRQMAVITLVATTAILALLLIAFRDWRATLLCFVPLLVSQVAVLWVARLLFNPVFSWSIGYVAIAMGLGLDAALHLTARFYRFLERNDPASAVEMAFSECGAPIVVGVLSTALAFLAILLGHSPGLRQFAVLTSVGLVLTMVITFSLFPVLVRILVTGRKRSFGLYPGSGFFRSIFAAVASRPYLWGAVAIALLVASFPLASRARLDLNALNLIPAGLRSIAAGTTVAEAFGGSFVLTGQVAVTAPDLESALAAQGLVDDELEQMMDEGLLAAFASPSGLLEDPTPEDDVRAAAAELRGAIMTARDTFFRLHSTLGFRDDPAFGTYFDALEHAVSEPQSASAEGPVSSSRAGLHIARDASGVHLQTTLWPAEAPDDLESIDTTALNEVTARLLALPLPSRATLEVTGILPVYDRVNSIVPSDLKRIAWIGAIAVAAVVLLFFRSVWAALLCLVPLAAALPTALAAAHVLDVRLTQTAVCFIAVVLGIGIDDAVHVLVRLRRHPDEEAGTVVREIGPVLTVTTASTAIGFGCLTFASLPVVSEMGEAIAIGVLGCWFFSIFLLPGLHLLSKKWRPGASAGVLLLLMVAGVCTPLMAKPTEGDVDEVLATLQERWQETEAFFCSLEQVKTIGALAAPVTLEGKLYFMKPMRVRLELSGDENLLLISDGETLWLHDLDLEEVEEVDLSKVGGASPSSLLPIFAIEPEELEHRFEITIEDSGQGSLLRLEPRTDSPAGGTILVELELDQHLRLLRSTVHLSNGDTVETEYSGWQRSEGFSRYLFQYHKGQE